MQYSLRSLMAVLLTSALVLAILVTSGFFKPDFESQNSQIAIKLGIKHDFQIPSSTVGELIDRLHAKYGIRAIAIGEIEDLKLAAVSADNIRLKSAIRLAINSNGLTYLIRNGKLEVIAKSATDRSR